MVVPVVSKYTSREEIISDLTYDSPFDILIIGGGIHGATFAYLSACHGLKVGLLERGDYASGTSSRSSKMAHGGLRYLELLDFKQVFEGIRARETLFHISSHLVQPAPFWIPVDKQHLWFKTKMSLGLFLYDLLVSERSRSHRWISQETADSIFRVRRERDSAGYFQYFDGLLDDARLTLDFIQAARLKNAQCLNYAEVHEVNDTLSCKAISWRDVLTGNMYETNAKVIINCSGPWATRNLYHSSQYSSQQVKYSRGIHLLFNVPWKGPSLFLPLPERSRYYFIWPHEAGTMVGTTEREVEVPEWDPLPEPDEVEEILSRLSKDIPNSNLNRHHLHYAYAGIRTLPLRTKKKNAPTLSRRHLWEFEKNVLTLFGGKLTTALSTSLQGLKIVSPVIGYRRTKFSISKELIRQPATESQKISLKQLERGLNLSPQLVQRLVQKFGREVDFFIENPERLNPVGPRTKGEIQYACRFEQAESLADLMRLRLQFEYFEGNGLGLLSEISKVLAIEKPTLALDQELHTYRQKIATLHERMFALNKVSHAA